jgi:hypothetical protein
MWSVTAAVAVSAYLGHGLDVCSPVQEDLDGPEAAFLSSPVEGSPSTLTDTQRGNTHGIQNTFYNTYVNTYNPTYSYIFTFIPYRV